MSTIVEWGVAHDEKSIFFIFCLKIPYGGLRNVVVFFSWMFFWTPKKKIKACFCPSCRENMRKKKQFNTLQTSPRLIRVKGRLSEKVKKGILNVSELFEYSFKPVDLFLRSWWSSEIHQNPLA